MGEEEKVGFAKCKYCKRIIIVENRKEHWENECPEYEEEKNE